MTKKNPNFKKQAIELTPAEFDNLDRIAAATGSLAPRGATTGQASWRSLIKRIANGELKVVPRRTLPGPAPATPATAPVLGPVDSVRYTKLEESA